MDSNKRRRLAEQVKRFRARFVQSVGSVLGDVIPSKLLMQWVTDEVDVWRERGYSPFTTLTLFLEQVLGEDHSCQDAVARALSTRVADGQSPCSLNTGPYCRARARLPVGLLEHLGREIGTRVCAQQPKEWLWHGRQVKLVDGSTLSMPDTAANQKRFPQNRSQKTGLGFPLARLVAIVSLSCGALLDWAVGLCVGKETGETALLWGLAQKLQRGDVVVADRAYAGYFMVAWLIQQGVDVVIRQHQRRHTDFRRGQQLGARDHLVSWTRPQRPTWMSEAIYANMPESLTMREARVAGWTLASTLIDPQPVSKRELFVLYRQRWHVELDLRSIKNVMQMDILRCKSPEMVEKEIAAHLVAYNLIRAVMAQAASLSAALPRQLSFKTALQILNAFEQNLRCCPRGRLTCRHAFLLAGIAQARLPNRPDRVEPRAVKRRPKPRALLTKPRQVLKKGLHRKQQTLQKHIDQGLR